LIPIYQVKDSDRHWLKIKLSLIRMLIIFKQLKILTRDPNVKLLIWIPLKWINRNLLVQVNQGGKAWQIKSINRKPRSLWDFHLSIIQNKWKYKLTKVWSPEIMIKFNNAPRVCQAKDVWKFRSNSVFLLNQRMFHKRECTINLTVLPKIKHKIN
jgi:hypothetical protein